MGYGHAFTNYICDLHDHHPTERVPKTDPEIQRCGTAARRLGGRGEIRYPRSNISNERWL
jgi:hypothetical protein